ncbi:MarR family transcriptional regulator [Chitinibacter sp. FCG-7]|uniref:MarR family transcriptional regulator n=1 Tax=Chitinibacter mangrovi TaxID=3153927 RepID=A0AAU7FAT4_9NEIS
MKEAAQTAAIGPADFVDGVLAQWQQEKPALDTRAMGTAGRLKRSAALMQRQMDQLFARYDLSSWEFDVLATLRRAGAPYCLAPTALFSALMLASGTMTRQLQQLENRGLVCRIANPQDARSLLVQLSENGLTLIDEAIEAHTRNLQHILSPLSDAQRTALDQGLSALLPMLEQTS